MNRISRDNYTFTFSAAHTPVLTIEPGEEVVIETRDGADGQIRTGFEDMRLLDTKRGNPVTGPVYIRGAELGDTLAIDVLDIKLASTGYLAVIAGVGVLKSGMKDKVKIVEVRGNKILFNSDYSIPVHPMIGTIGTVWNDHEIEANYPGPNGGNMDNIEVSAGSTIYLPVKIKGALLSLGDVHANQGNGELMGSALEIEAEVKVRIRLIKGHSWERPWIENDHSWITCADAPVLEDAIRIATQDMVFLLGEKMDLNKEDAYMIVSLMGGAYICQACQGSINSTVRIVIPKMKKNVTKGVKTDE
jgi:amidase